MSYIVTRTLQKHEGGTKFYEISLVHNTAKNRILLIKRYGKISQAGQFKIEHFESSSAAAMEFKKTLEQRKKRGYEEPIRHDYNCVDWAEVETTALVRVVKFHLEENPEHINFITGGSGMSTDGDLDGEIDAAPEEKKSKPQLPDIPDWASW